MGSQSSRWDPPLLLVFWVDAASGGETWTTLDEYEEPDMLVKSVGWLVREDERKLTLAMNKGQLPECKDLKDTITIPRSWVTETRTLSEDQRG